jgi:two-component system invasion response regulator UvrY
MTRILIVDDHPMVRRGIVQVLALEFPAGVLGEAATAAEALDAVWKQDWDLVLLDLSLPGRNGLEVLKEIKAARSKLPVLVFSTYPESQFATRVLRAGAAGYLTKGAASALLIHAVRQALSGGKFISPAAAEQLASQIMIDSSKLPHELLSDREYDVFLRIGSGQAVGEIATILNLSVKTVSTYRTRILEKTGMKSNADVVQYVMRNKLVE